MTVPEIGSRESSQALVPSRFDKLEKFIKVTVEEPEDHIQSLAIEGPSQDRYRIPRTSPPPARKIKKLRKKQGRCLESKARKAEKTENIKNKVKKPARKHRYCKVCDVSCNSAATFYDHKQSKGHKNKVANIKKPPICETCAKEFESHHHLSRHLKGRAHFKELAKKKKTLDKVSKVCHILQNV